MTRQVQAFLTIQITDPYMDMPFELVEDQDNLGVPVVVNMASIPRVLVTGWDNFRVPETATASVRGYEFSPLSVNMPGTKYLRLYCPENESVPQLTIDDGPMSQQHFLDTTTGKVWTRQVPTHETRNSRHTNNWVDFNTATKICRISSPVEETIEWSGEKGWKSLKYPYDTPEVTILHHTHFINDRRETIAVPFYDQQKGAFWTPYEAYGAIRVRYHPAYNLYRITYGNGRRTMSQNAWDALQTAWYTGNITAVTPPPIRVMATSFRKIATIELERKFWPEGHPETQWQASEQQVVSFEGVMAAAYDNYSYMVNVFATVFATIDNVRILISTEGPFYLDVNPGRGFPRENSDQYTYFNIVETMSYATIAFQSNGSPVVFDRSRLLRMSGGPFARPVDLRHSEDPSVIGSWKMATSGNAPLRITLPFGAITQNMVGIPFQLTFLPGNGEQA